MNQRNNGDLPLASRVDFAHDPVGKLIGFVFATPNGPVGAALPREKMGVFIGLLLDELQKTMRSRRTASTKDDSISAHPIPVEELGIRKTSNASEALLAARSGDLTLLFSVQRAALADICAELHRMKRPLQSQTKPN